VRKPRAFLMANLAFGVHALYGAGGDLPFGNEPVEDEVVVTPEGTRDLLHRLQSGAQGAGTPLVEDQLAQRAPVVTARRRRATL